MLGDTLSLHPCWARPCGGISGGAVLCMGLRTGVRCLPAAQGHAPLACWPETFSWTGDAILTP